MSHRTFSFNPFTFVIYRHGDINYEHAFCISSGHVPLPSYIFRLPSFFRCNYFIGSVYLLATKVFEYNSQVERYHEGSTAKENEASVEPNLKALLKEYEHRRWLPTTSITAKAAFLGESL